MNRRQGLSVQLHADRLQRCNPHHTWELPDGETMPPVKRAMLLPVFDVLITGRFISVAFPQPDRYAFSRTP